MRSLLLRFRPWSRLLAALTAGLLTVGRAPAAVAQCSLPPPTVNASTPLCEGGMLILLSSGVPMGADYLWTGPNGFTATRANPRVPNITGAGSGYYKLQITFNGCTSADSVNVAVQARPTVTITASGPTTICQGGSVTLTASGAASYVWSTGASTPSITVTQSGNYAVTGFSTNNCSGTAGPINVNVVAAPTISIAASGPTSFCQGGSVVLTATVAPGSATVLWSTGATGLSITVTQSGTYSATASRANGCSVPSNPLSVRVSALPTPTLAASGPTTFCAGGFVTLTATGGGTYQWSNGATTASITVTQSGMYSATVTNAQGCSAPTGSIRVTVQPAPTITIAASGSPALCQGSTLTLTATASPNSSIRWSNGAMGPSITVGNAGTYSATARFPNGANSCSTTSSPITVTVAPAPTVSVSASGATTFCQGGSVTLTASGATTYQWSTGATTATISVTTSGSYSVMGTASGCAATSAPVTVTVNPAPAALTTADASHCGPGALTLTASAAPAGATYQWYTTATGGTPLSGVTGGTFTTPTLSATTTYYVSARSGAGCEGPRTPVTATINALPTATIAASGPTTFCAGGSVTLTAPAAAGYSYRWSTGATTATITVNTSGSYSVTVTTAASCSATSAATTITINPAPLALAATGASRCGPGAVTLTASGAPTGATYRWYPMATGGTPLSGVTGGTFTTPTLSATTTYYVSARSGAGCEGPRTPVTATINAPPTATIAASGPTTFCAGDSVPLTASGGGTYRWSTGATTRTISVSTSGAYSVTVTNAAGCSSTAQTTVQVRATPVLTVSPSQTLCAGSSTTLSASGAQNYTWSPSTGLSNPRAANPIASPTTTTTYTVTGDNGGCSATATVTITVEPLPTPSAGPDRVLCSGQSAQLGSAPVAGLTYSWSPSTGLSSTSSSQPIVTPTNP
ncbi:MAG: hypothetical protein H7330_07455, partial [Hymenobacteraceae bacterium]|nr:hypothetical protein [Hymenobacteraceae bacterium]